MKWLHGGANSNDDRRLGDAKISEKSQSLALCKASWWRARDDNLLHHPHHDQTTIIIMQSGIMLQTLIILLHNYLHHWNLGSIILESVWWGLLQCLITMIKGEQSSKSCSSAMEIVHLGLICSISGPPLKSFILWVWLLEITPYALSLCRLSYLLKWLPPFSLD